MPLQNFYFACHFASVIILTEHTMTNCRTKNVAWEKYELNRKAVYTTPTTMIIASTLMSFSSRFPTRSSIVKLLTCVGSSSSGKMCPLNLKLFPTI